MLTWVGQRVNTDITFVSIPVICRSKFCSFFLLRPLQIVYNAAACQKISLDCCCCISTGAVHSATTQQRCQNTECMQFYPSTYTHTHTHTFNGPLSGTTRVSRYQKGETNLDFTEARDSEWQWNQLGRMQVCTSLQTDNHTNTSPHSFLQARCPSCRPTNSAQPTASEHWRLKANSTLQHPS